MIKKSDKIAYLQKTKKVLETELQKAQKKLVATRIKVRLGQEKDHSKLKKIRYEIALIKTILKIKLNQKDEKNQK